MDSDIPLKMAFRARTRDFLPLMGDSGARVLSALAYELPEGKRTVDLVLRLRRGGEEYLRHIEFQTRHEGDVAVRCFEYASRLAVRSGRPVLTTVIYLRSPGRDELAYRHTLAGRVVNEWRFDVVQLWKESPAAQRPDLLATLQVFAEGRYTARQLARVIPEEVVMASGLFEKAVAKGRTEGLAKGRTQGLSKGRTQEARQICVELAKALHPAVAGRVVPAIEACSELTRLRRWALRAPRVSDVEFARLVTGRGAARPTRRRVPRPARKAVRSASR